MQVAYNLSGGLKATDTGRHGRRQQKQISKQIRLQQPAEFQVTYRRRGKLLQRHAVQQQRMIDHLDLRRFV